MTILWLTMVAFDAMTGFRFELLYPAWLMIRAAVESIQMRNQHCVTTIANPSSARFSILFVCVTATSDLICYLFIPIRFLVFIATVFVWINYFYQTQGGFLRTVATVYGGERSQAWPIMIITCFIVFFELFLRIRITRIDYIMLFRSHPMLIGVFPNVSDWTSISPVWPRSLNAFFGAHSIGYPVILTTVSLHQFLNEWKLRRKQGDVSNRNEQLFRILVESLPAEYEGPKDYTSQQCLEEGNDLYYLDPPVSSSQPMQAIQAAPASATPPTTSKKNGIGHKRNGEVTSSSSMTSSKKKKNGSAFNSTPPSNDKKKIKSIRSGGDVDLEDLDDSDNDDYSWRDQSGSEEHRRAGGLSILRIVFGTAWWMISALFVNSPSERSSHRVDDEDDDDEIELEKKNGRTDSLTNSSTTTTKGRANTMPSSTTTTRNQNNNNKDHQQQQQQKHHKQSNGKSHHHHQNQHQKTNGNLNGHSRSATIRDSSHDTNGSNETDIRSMSRELESLRAEISSRRSLEEDYKLQISIHESNENRLSQQLSNMKCKVDQMEIKYSTLERHRESDKSQLEQAERKYSDLLGKKTEIETTLSVERKTRMENTSKKYDVAEHQRERERQLESEIDKLRIDLKSKDESNLRMESELHRLRNYKEDNDIEGLTMELRIVRDKSLQMEESLAGENKLKQSLFKCLGDARDTIKSLERRCNELQIKNGSSISGGSGSSETLMNGRSSTEANNENDTTASDQSSPHQHSAMGSPIPFAKMPLTVNVSNRHGSPFNEKMSPIASIGSVMAAVTGVPAPPDYMMAVGASAASVPQKQSAVVGFPGIRYNEFTHMPTGGEHRLFDTPTLSAPSPNGTDPEDDFLLNKGKFGPPAQPTARLA